MVLKSKRGEKYYDGKSKRLVFVRSAPTSDYWDSQWVGKLESDHASTFPRRGTLVVRTTKRFLPPGSMILEGGCGTGVNSRDLLAAGYHVAALDFAPATITWLGRNVPEINPVLGDIRALPYASSSFDGYWSLGVIEHFLQGFNDVCDEMRRVLRPQGYLFLTFPYINPLRRVAVAMGGYPAWDEHLKEHFYQYALGCRDVECILNEYGFSTISRIPHLALGGAEDHWHRLEAVFDGLRSGGLARKMAGVIIGRVLRPLTSHLMLLVLKKQ